MTLGTRGFLSRQDDEGEDDDGDDDDDDEGEGSSGAALKEALARTPWYVGLHRCARRSGYRSRGMIL